MGEQGLSAIRSTLTNQSALIDGLSSACATFTPI